MSLLRPKSRDCDYCSGERKKIASNRGGRVMLNNHSIVLEIRNDDGSYTQEGWCWADINFCPCCGRKLR